MENLVVEYAVFPRAHIRNSLVMRNVLFRNCIMYNECWCGVSFVGCRFERCVFVSAQLTMRVNARLCEMDSCTWMFQAMPHHLPSGLLEMPDWVNGIVARLPSVALHNCIITRVNPGTFPTRYMMTVSYKDVHAKVVAFLVPGVIKYYLRDK